MIKVFCYGTLKPGERNYQRYCGDKVIEKKRAIALGKLFDLPVGYPAMIPGNNRVRGFLLTFADAASLRDLDVLEDYDPQRPPKQNEYQRQLIQTFALNGQPLDQAWTYLMTPEQVRHQGGIFLPDGWWSAKGN